MAPSFYSVLFLLLLAFSPAVAYSDFQSLIRTVPEDGPDADRLYCDSWRLSVEANNAGSWRKIPDRCSEYVKEYIYSERYASDSNMVAAESLAFAKTVPIAGDRKDVWIFDLDEVLLSNLPYYARHEYGWEVFNETAFHEWIYQSIAPALPASLKLYHELLGLGFQIVLLPGRSEEQRNATEANLLFAGYHSWFRLLLREDNNFEKPAKLFKSEKRAELEAEGFRIHGSSGDQWSDLLGPSMARRSFKLPNPMYHID